MKIKALLLIMKSIMIFNMKKAKKKIIQMNMIIIEIGINKIFIVK